MQMSLCRVVGVALRDAGRAALSWPANGAVTVGDQLLRVNAIRHRFKSMKADKSTPGFP